VVSFAMVAFLSVQRPGRVELFSRMAGRSYWVDADR